MTSGDTGDSDAAFLRERYDADVEMFGNSIFKPGMHVYIDPSTVGAGSPEQMASIASRLGLGGYFQITNVKCAVESGKFGTDIKCVWVASGDGKTPVDKCGEKDEKCQDGQSGASAPPTGAPKIGANPG